MASMEGARGQEVREGAEVILSIFVFFSNCEGVHRGTLEGSDMVWVSAAGLRLGWRDWSRS